MVDVQSQRTLVERDEALAELHASLARARAGRGEVALVTGEAGAGKTSVIGEFIRHAAGRPTVLRGACDPLSTPRPLGPLIDAAGDLDRELARRLAAGMPRVEAFAAALSLVDGSRNGGRATIFVVEDAHWADDATLDLLTFLGRRVAGWPTLLVISYRDDDVGLLHPLRARLGELSSATRCRVRLEALSPVAVAELAMGTTVDANALHRMTGGNAFYVTEVLATGTESVPESIRDAVLARAASLPDEARVVLDAAAVAPGRIEHWLLEAIVGDVDGRAGLEICVERGLLQLGAARTVAFRHELARLAILDAQPIRRRQDFHRRAMGALCGPHGGEPDPTRLAFHAAEADDVDAVLRYAPIAATEAVAIGAHREAAHHLESALRYRHRLEPVEAAHLLLRLGDELMTIGLPDAAITAFNDAAATFATVSDIEGRAEAIVRCDRPLVALGRQFEARNGFAQVTQLLAGRGPSRAAALIAMSNAAAHMLARQFDVSERDGQQAISLAEQIGDDRVLAEALIQSGIAVVMSGDDEGMVRVRRGIDLATRIDADNLVALGLTQIGTGLGELRRYEIAVPSLREGIAFASAREFVSSTQYASAWLARCELELGNWDEATAIAGELAANPRCLGINRFVALLTLGWLRGRRGDPAVAPLLDEALEFARATRHLQRLWPVAACRAEIAWLENRLDDEVGLLTEASSVAEELRYQPAIEELAHWLRVGDGKPRGDIDHVRTPFGLSAAGRCDLAAVRWAEIGCPYEQAMALYLSEAVDDLNAAHRIFEALGAAPMRTRTASALRAAGAPVPRGPAASTRDNPYLLTDREIDVLVLVATGRTDRQIAGELGISSKTVGHHVSHLLAKLDVRSRSEAAVVAERVGLLSRSRTNR